jgi:hypothetical protein
VRWWGQAGQDRWVIDTLGNEPGVFVDVGAYDGVATSNTLCLESDFGWTGLCIEPDPDAFRHLAGVRNCHCINVAVADKPGEVVIQPTGRTCPALPLGDIIDRYFPPNVVIDYLSIDIEGAEMSALRTIDFSRRQVRTITIEHNLYRDGPTLKDAIYAHLTGCGFTRAVEDATCIHPGPPPAYVGAPFEDWYQRPNVA